ncbi:MAG: AI-2E family transporter, partial [Maritimibacter sp.]|nr:AI-2E family transporter [Maritimibacter sp.]
QFVTPTLLGRQMRLSPLLVFGALAFWLWLWGPVGGIVAIPLLLWGLEIFRDDHDWRAPQAGVSASRVSADPLSMSETE